ncbi:MAG: cytochrome c3 family protein [Gammaproteobacteria bacterium]|nr:cytochrome c3 family protein [Gammaproteobacteria bacterium]
MSNYKHFIMLLLFFATPAVFMKIVFSDINTQDFHPRESSCQQCHLAQGQITAANASQLLATQEKLCSGCHEKSLKVSHPSGLIPGQKLPDKFPLDWKNEMTCSTCHNVHTNGKDSIRGGISGKQLCLSCHQMSFFTNMADSGTSIQQTVHKGRISNDFSSADSYSMECMACHGNEGDTVNVSINSKGIVKHSSGAVNHPVGMRYVDSYGKGSYVAIEKLSDKVILPDGKVSCVSCHKGYSKKHGEMISVKSKTALCLECHDM